MRSGAKCSGTGKILSEKNNAMESMAGLFTLQRPEIQNRWQRYQYCWFCRITSLTTALALGHIVMGGRGSRSFNLEYRRESAHGSRLIIWFMWILLMKNHGVHNA